MLAWSLGPVGGWIVMSHIGWGGEQNTCASKDAGPRRGVDLVAAPHQLEKRTSVSEDVGPRRGVDCNVPH